MDALAAYGSDSDDSGSESMPAPAATRASSSTAVNTGAASAKISSLSSLLPPPKSTTNPAATTTTKSSSASASVSASASAPTQPKTSKYHSLPTLEPESDSDEEESVFRKKAKLAEAAKMAGSGVGALFAMLPAPKSTPTAATTGSSSDKSASAKPAFMPRTVKKPGPPKKPAPTVQDEKEDQDEDEDDEDDDEAPVSFFPLGAAAIAAPVTAQSSNGKAASNTFIPLFFDKKPLTTEEKQAQSHEEVDVSMTNEQYSYSGNEQYAYSDQYAYPTNDQYAYPTNDAYAYGADGYAQGSDAGDHGANTVALDNAGLQKLGMRKGRDAPINVIDVSARNQMSQAQHVRTAMSGRNAPPKPVDLSSIQHLKPSATLKRKHNIMSLAYEAKANEAQLNANWAASRKTKAETQAKYGF